MPMFIPLIIAVGMSAAGITTGIVAGLMIAGGALTAIGGVTGDKDLMMLGSVLGLAGGAAGLAGGGASATASSVAADSSLNTGAALTETAGTTAPAATDAAEFAAMDSAASTAGGTGAGLADAGSATAGATSSVVADTAPTLADAGAAGGGVVTDGAMSGIVDSANPALGSSGTGVADNAATGNTALSGSGATDAANASAASVKSPIQPLLGSGPVAPSTAVTAPSVAVNPTQVTAAGPVVDSSGTNLFAGQTPAQPGLLGQAGDMVNKGAAWMKANPELVKAGSGLIGGAANNASKQRLMQQQYDLEWAQNQKARDRYNASMAGLKMPSYVAPTKA